MWSAFFATTPTPTRCRCPMIGSASATRGTREYAACRRMTDLRKDYHMPIYQSYEVVRWHERKPPSTNSAARELFRHNALRRGIVAGKRRRVYRIGEPPRDRSPRTAINRFRFPRRQRRLYFPGGATITLPRVTKTKMSG